MSAETTTTSRPDMATALRPILVLLLAVFLMMAGAGTLTTVLGVRLDAVETPPLVIGAIMAAYFAGLTLGSLQAYKVIARAGHIRSFSAFASLLSAATLGHALGLDEVLWGILRLIEGFCMAGLFVCVESWLNQSAKPETRGQILAFYMISLYGGQGVGQFLLTIPDDRAFVLYVLISILLSVALVPVALTRQAPPMLPDIASFGFRRLYQASPLGIVGTLISGLVSGALYGLAPVYVRRLGYGVSDTALFMSAAILGGVVLQWPLGRLSDLFDRRVVLVGLFALLVVVSGGMILAGPAGLWPLLTAIALFGGITFALYPICVAHTNDHLSASDMVSASGGLVLGYSMGATIGPFLASAAMTAAGAPGLFLFSGLVGAGAVLFGLWRMRARPPVPSELQAPYRVLPRTTPVVAPLDPRAASDEE